MSDTTKTPFAPATPSQLVGAYVIDLMILGALLAATWFIYFTPLTIIFITVEAVIAAGIMLGASGRTPGMAAMRVCLIRDEDDTQTPSLGAAMGYIALVALLQITFVGPLAALAMARDGRTWLTGPTRTRLVDLRKHAALAAGPGAAGMAGYSEHPRPGQAPNGFDGIHPASSPVQWGAPSAPLTPVPQAGPDFSAPGRRANDPYAPDYSAPQAVPSTSSTPATPSAPAAPSAPATPSAPAAPTGPSVPPQGMPDTRRPAPTQPEHAPAAQASAVPPVPTFSSPASEVPPVPTFSSPASEVPAVPPALSSPASRVPAAPAPQDPWDLPAPQAPAQAAPASYSEPTFETMPYHAFNGATSGVPAPPPSRRAVQAGQAAQQAYAAQQAQGVQGGAQWGDAGRSQWGAPAAPARAQLLWIIFDSGQRELIDEPLTLGRQPVPVEGTRSIIVPDTTLSLSRTHMRIGPTAAGAWIEDAFSANGTEIRTPDGRIAALAGGQAVEVPAGTEIVIGDRRATIVLADADSVH